MDSLTGGGLSPQAIAVAAGVGLIILLTAIKLFWGMALWTKKTEHRIGASWAGVKGEVVEWAGDEGLVSAGGELWKARANTALAPGDEIKVVRADGLVLEVSRI